MQLTGHPHSCKQCMMYRKQDTSCKQLGPQRHRKPKMSCNCTRLGADDGIQCACKIFPNPQVQNVLIGKSGLPEVTSWGNQYDTIPVSTLLVERFPTTTIVVISGFSARRMLSTAFNHKHSHEPTPASSHMRVQLQVHGYMHV